MKKMKNSLALIRSALLALATVATSAQADWIRMESEHFTITSNGAERQVRNYLEKLEAFRTMSMQLLGANPSASRAQLKFDIYLLRRQSMLSIVRPEFGENVGGVYFSCVEGSTAYSSLERSASWNGADISLQTLFHEYAHHLTFQYAGIRYPNWYVEGFAEFLSSAEVRPETIRLGEIPAGRSGNMSADSWIPFKDVLASAKSFGAANSDPFEASAFYAQSWLLTHFMLTDRRRAADFTAYFQRLNAGEDALAAFEPATGIAVNSLEGRLRAYVDDFKAYDVPVSAQPAPAITLVQLPKEASDEVLIASLLKSCPSQSQGKSILAQLRAQAIKNPDPRASSRLALARAEILYGDTAAALQGLQAPLPEDAQFELHYLRGRALLKNAAGVQGDAAKEPMGQAQDEFLAAYRLKKLDAPNLFFLARSLATEAPNTNALNAARGARTLAPSVGEYAVQEALMDLGVNERDRAVKALLPLSFDPHHPDQAARVRRVIEAIKADAKPDEVRRLLREEEPSKP